MPTLCLQGEYHTVSTETKGLGGAAGEAVRVKLLEWAPLAPASPLPFLPWKVPMGGEEAQAWTAEGGGVISKELRMGPSEVAMSIRTE